MRCHRRVLCRISVHARGLGCRRRLFRPLHTWKNSCWEQPCSSKAAAQPAARSRIDGLLPDNTQGTGQQSVAFRTTWHVQEDATAHWFDCSLRKRGAGTSGSPSFPYSPACAVVAPPLPVHCRAPPRMHERCRHHPSTQMLAKRPRPTFAACRAAACHAAGAASSPKAAVGAAPLAGRLHVGHGAGEELVVGLHRGMRRGHHWKSTCQKTACVCL